MLEPLEPLAMSSAGYAVAIVLGLLWGSFANVCIYRMPLERSVVTPGSHCGACQAPIHWYDNIPVLAWLWLRGRCRACKAPFSVRYLVVEITCGALFGVAWWDAVVATALFEPFPYRLLHFAIYAAFCVVMVIIAFIDLDHQLILNKITLPSIAVFYVASFAWPERHWYDGLFGAAVGYGIPWAIGALWYLLRRIEAMGGGDSMLMAMVGALLGWTGVLVVLCVGSMLGSLITIPSVIIARRRGHDPASPGAVDPEAGPSVGSASDPEGDPASPPGEDEKPSVLRTEVPFGTFLAMAAVLYLFAEPWIQFHFHLPGG